MRHLATRPQRSFGFWSVIGLGVMGSLLVVGAIEGAGAVAGPFAPVTSPPAAPSTGTEVGDGAVATGGSLDSAVEDAPRGDLPGWRQVFVDDFQRDDLGDDWGKYSGRPGGDPYSWWEPSQVLLEDGSLRLRTEFRDGRWVTGGASLHTVAQTYGKWEVRVRVDPNDNTAYHFLLWPQNEVWPPEVDFVESFDGSRQTIDGFVHWMDGDTHRVMQRSTRVDMSQWHVVGVEWTPDRLVYTLDGEPWTVIDDPGTSPETPMWLALQTSTSACQRMVDFGYPICPQVGVKAVSDVVVDWVAVYAPE